MTTLDAATEAPRATTVYRVRCLEGCGVLAWTADARLAADIGLAHQHEVALRAEPRSPAPGGAR
jgi:hypothetical protein